MEHRPADQRRRPRCDHRPARARARSRRTAAASARRRASTGRSASRWSARRSGSPTPETGGFSAGATEFPTATNPPTSSSASRTASSHSENRGGDGRPGQLPLAARHRRAATTCCWSPMPATTGCWAGRRSPTPTATPTSSSANPTSPVPRNGPTVRTRTTGSAFRTPDLASTGSAPRGGRHRQQPDPAVGRYARRSRSAAARIMFSHNRISGPTARTAGPRCSTTPCAGRTGCRCAATDSLAVADSGNNRVMTLAESRSMRPRIVQTDDQIGFFWATPDGRPTTLAGAGGRSRRGRGRPADRHSSRSARRLADHRRRAIRRDPRRRPWPGRRRRTRRPAGVAPHPRPALLRVRRRAGADRPELPTCGPARSSAPPRCSPSAPVSRSGCSGRRRSTANSTNPRSAWSAASASSSTSTRTSRGWAGAGWCAPKPDNGFR